MLSSPIILDVKQNFFYRWNRNFRGKMDGAYELNKLTASPIFLFELL